MPSERRPCDVHPTHSRVWIFLGNRVVQLSRPIWAHQNIFNDGGHFVGKCGPITSLWRLPIGA